MTQFRVQRVNVVGAGQMGAGIAQVFAQQGASVCLTDASLEQARKGRASIVARLERQVSGGKLKPEARDSIAAQIEAAAEPDPEAELAVEAAPERLELKRELMARLDGIMKPGTLLCSNTSSISITTLAAATTRPEQVVGMHFMNPVPKMELVEVVRGVATSKEALERVLGIAHWLQKTTIVSEDRPGFVVNRVLLPLLNEACFALQEGVACIEDIDTGVQLGLNHPLGPLALADLIGLDTVLAIAEVLGRDLGEDKYRPAPLLRNLVAAGWLGRKAGRGFYCYDERGKPAGPNPDLERR